MAIRIEPGWGAFRAVAEICGDVHVMTIRRWMQREDLNFPRPSVVRGHYYWNLEEVRQWWKTRQEVAGNVVPGRHI
jgi:hypothetical protein